MQLEDERKTGVVLGSFKNGAWSTVVDAVQALKNSGVNVTSPCDTRLSGIAVNDGDFYYLQSDLEQAGLTEKDLEGLSDTAIAVKLGFLPLQRNVLKNILHLGPNGCVYLANLNDYLGKSSAHELVIAGLAKKRLALNFSIREVSPVIAPDTREFLQSRLLSQVPIISLGNLRNGEALTQFVQPTFGITSVEAIRLFRSSVSALLPRISKNCVVGK